MTTLEVLLVAILLGWLYALIFARWQRGLYWLVTYLPFAGAVTIATNLWWPSLLFKDIFCAIPLYIAFSRALYSYRNASRGFHAALHT